MTSFLFSLFLIPVSSSSHSCKYKNTDSLPNGVAFFDEFFGISSNAELQKFRDEVIANQCNFGDSSLSSSLFKFDSNYTNLHNGAFGSPSKYVLKYQEHIRNFLLSKPHLWDDVHSMNVMNVLRQSMASYIGITDSKDLVFTINASHGMNAVIRSLMDHFIAMHKDKINEYAVLHFNIGHPAFVAPLKYYEKLFGIKRLSIELDIETLADSENLLLAIKNFLSEHKNEKILFCVFSHISSLPSVILPLSPILTLLNEHGIIPVVDGAHSLGQIDVFDAEQADFYIFGGYKWLYSPWNTALIYVKKEYQSIMKPSAIASDGTYLALFHHPGTVDESAYLSMMAALEFRYLIGGEKNIRCFIHETAVSAQLLLSNLWNSTILSPDHKGFVGMINIELPTVDNWTWTKEKMTKVHFTLLKQHNFAVKLFSFRDRFYIRVSVQIYTNLEQIQKIGMLILEIIVQEIAIEQTTTNKQEL